MRSRSLKILLFGSLLIGCGLSARQFWVNWLLYSATIQSNKLYATYRPFAYRWREAPYGKTSDPNTCFPVPQHELDKFLFKEAQAEKISGQTSRSLQLLGRAALLACQPEESINTYQNAIHLDPENTDLQLELGMAFAIDASLNKSLEYEAALEHMLRAGGKKSPEFLFDSALLFQETQLPIQARERWMDAALAESVTSWKEESNRWVAASQDLLRTREQMISALSSPASFLAADGKQQQDGEELALESATEEWLINTDSLDARRAIQQLSGLLFRDHHDRWLGDLSKSQASEENNRALTLLAQAIHFNLKGEHRHAEDSAELAEKKFRNSNDTAGALRAQVEIVYSLDRQARADDCLRAMEGLEETARKKNYVWIEAQARLEQITCRTRSRTWDVIETRKDAYAWISRTGYHGLALRSLGFMTEGYVAANSRGMLWRHGEEGLRIFWSLPLPPLRGYSFYYTLAASAEKAGNLQTAIAILREGTLLLKGSGLNLIHGILLSSLGQWEIEAGLNAIADLTFDEMSTEFKQLEPEEINQVWEEAEVAHAEALTATGRARESLALLSHRTEGTTWPYPELNPNLRRVLLPAFGNAYLRTGDLPKACNSFFQSINETQDKIVKVHSLAQRDNALREIESSWRGLTAVKLILSRPAEALAVWETFRSGRNLKKPDFIFPNCESTSSPPIFSMPKGTTALVYAFLPNGLSAWIVGEGRIEQKQLDGTGIKERVEKLSTLVADPNSSAEDISILSAELYKALVAPLADALPRSGTLVIDPDSELAAIPWSMLEDSHLHPLVERFSISQVIGILDLRTDPKERDAGLDRALIFGPPALNGQLGYKYPFLPDATEEAAAVHQLLPNSLFFPNDEANFETLKAYAPQSSLFHFPGHAISNGGFSALLLPNSRRSSPDAQYVTAEQIATLNLSRMRTVVLASCSSGTGEKTGAVNLDSLTRAFLEAGTRRVIAAGWDVNSGRTADLMLEFYNRLLQGDKPAEALRLSQLKVRSLEPHPFNWAAFQVFGEP